MPPPDADLYPTATGLAKATVDKHSSKESLILYAGWFCPSVPLLTDVAHRRLLTTSPVLVIILSFYLGMVLTSELVQRTWTVLEEKGIPYQYVEVSSGTFQTACEITRPYQIM